MSQAVSPTRTVATIDPVDDPAWLALLDHYRAGLFHSRSWIAALRDAYGFKARAYLVNGGPQDPPAGVAFCEVDDVLGRRVLSLPFSDACDPLVASPPAWDALLGRLVAHAVPVRLRCLDNPLVRDDRRLAVVKQARWHSLSLEPPPDALWAGLAAATRRAIRKAERSGVVVRRLAGARGVGEFRNLHVALRKHKYRLLAQPLAFFEALRHRFEAVEGWFPLGAYLDGRLVAAAIFLRCNDALYYKFAASALDALAARPNDLLVWTGAKLGRELGCRRLDLGPSDDDQPGLIRFKRQFGAEEKEVRFLEHLPPGWRDERAAETRRLLGNLTALLTAPGVPDDVAAEAGNTLYRFFA